MLVNPANVVFILEKRLVLSVLLIYNTSMSTKICFRCQREKPVDEFYKSARLADGLQSNCKICNKVHSKRHYEENRDLYIERAAISRKKLMDWYRDIKRSLVCSVCGDDKPWRLVHHHIDPSTKSGSVSIMLTSSGSKEEIIEEMGKCVVVCHNCHADIHMKHYYE